MKKLAILGASYLQLPLVLKAKELKIETHCFAWDNDEAVCKFEADYFYSISVLNTEAILKKCREIGIDGITTIATDICVPVIAAIASELGLKGNSIKSALLSTNKGEMRKAFDSNGVSSPKSVSVTATKDPVSFAFPRIVKPTDRSGSRGVTLVHSQKEYEIAVSDAIFESLEKKAVVEEFISGSEVSVETISWNGTHHILAVTDKVTTNSPYFVELEHHQPSLHSDEIIQKIHSETLKALDALEITDGAGHSEFKITKDGRVVIIEVGARMGGDFIGSHLTELSTGYDFLKGVIDVALNQFEDPQILGQNFSGVYFLCKETASLLPYFQKDNIFEVEKKILKPELYSIRNSNDRSGYLIYKDSHKIDLR